MHVICIPRILKNMQSEKYQYQLDNGLQCVLINSNEKEFTDKVSFALTIKCGSIDGNVHKKETAHLLEHIHMRFDKDKKNSNKYFYTKASTNFRSTTYYITCQAMSWEYCCNLLVDIYSNEKITESNRTESLNEIFAESKMRYSDKKNDLLKNMYLFKDTILYKYLLNTEMENALDISIHDLKKFHNCFYTTTNSQLVMIFYGTTNEFSIYKEKLKRIFENVKRRNTYKKESISFNICNNKIYTLRDFLNVNKSITVFEIKQSEDFISEKIKKGLFFQYMNDLIDEYLKKQNIKLCGFSIQQFENESFLFNFTFGEIVNGKEVVNDMCDFFLRNLHSLEDRIFNIQNQVLEVKFLSHELLEYVENSFVYSQPDAYESTYKLKKKVELILKEYDLEAIIKIIKNLKESNYKTFILK